MGQISLKCSPNYSEVLIGCNHAIRLGLESHFAALDQLLLARNIDSTFTVSSADKLSLSDRTGTIQRFSLVTGWFEPRRLGHDDL